jgi:predicted TPR repeat methyltransferase
MLRSAHWTGVEVWGAYIEEYNLKDRYDYLINDDIRKLDFFKIGNFDLCFLGDVLEHMTKEESIAVVDNVLTYCKHVIISIPIVYMPQGAFENNPYEIHIKDDWSDEEVKSTFSYIKDSAAVSKIGVYYLRKD